MLLGLFGSAIFDFARDSAFGLIRGAWPPVAVITANAA